MMGWEETYNDQLGRGFDKYDNTILIIIGIIISINSTGRGL